MSHAIPEKERTPIEQAIARGWTTSQIMRRLGADYETVWRVRRLLHEAAFGLGPRDDDDEPAPADGDTLDEALVLRYMDANADTSWTCWERQRPELVEAIRRLARQGVSDRAIARHVHRSARRVCDIRVAYGIPIASERAA